MYIVNIFRLSLDVKREEVWSSHLIHTSLQTENKKRTTHLMLQNDQTLYI